MTTHLSGATSVADMMRKTVAAFPDKVSHRIHAKPAYKDITYRQFLADVLTYARGLKTLGLQPGDRLVIMAESCYEWALTDWAALCLGLVVVPIYPTLPPDQAQYIADDCQAKVAICLDQRLAAKLTGKAIVLLRPESGEGALSGLGAESSFTIDDLNQSIDAITLNEIATIIYTSGTTGHPKGVMLTQENFVFLCSSVLTSLPVSETDTFLSFLPLSHVYERMAGHILPVSLGATIAYAGSLASLPADLMMIRPTILLCVPRFLENMRNRIIDGVAKQTSLEQKLFHLALSQGIARSKGKFAPLFPFLDNLVGKNVRARLGGRIRLLVSGGAALPPHVSEFYIAFGFLALQGYGLTETCAASALNVPDDNKPWTVGHPIEGVEVKIAGDGEILIRGKSVMAGYFNLPEATAQAIDSEGWFHTGDIGEFEGKSLKITDRKKDLLVLGNGKNVAPQPIENLLKQSELVNEAVLFGDGMEYCCALIVPELERLRTRLKAQGVTEPDNQKMVALPEARAIMKVEVDRANATLADYERVKKYVLVGKLFTVDDGELTPSLKVRKKVVKEMYAEAIKSMQRA